MDRDRDSYEDKEKPRVEERTTRDDPRRRVEIRTYQVFIEPFYRAHVSTEWVSSMFWAFDVRTEAQMTELANLMGQIM